LEDTSTIRISPGGQAAQCASVRECPSRDNATTPWLSFARSDAVVPWFPPLRSLRVAPGLEATRTVTVAALEAGETLSVGGDAYRALLDEYPELKDVLVALLAERLRYSDERILAAHFLDADARVRWALLQLVPIYGDGHHVRGCPARRGKSTAVR